MSCGSADEQERNLNIVRASDPRRKRDEFQRFRAGLFLTPLTVAFRGIVVESKNTRFEWRACGSLDPLFSPRLEPSIGIVLLAIFCTRSRILGESLKRSSEERNAGETTSRTSFLRGVLSRSSIRTNEIRNRRFVPQ